MRRCAGDRVQVSRIAWACRDGKVWLESVLVVAQGSGRWDDGVAGSGVCWRSDGWAIFAVGTWVTKFDAAAPEGGKQLIRIDACSEIGVQLLGCVIKIGMTWIQTERKLVMRQKKRGESRRFDGATG